MASRILEQPWGWPYIVASGRVVFERPLRLTLLLLKYRLVLLGVRGNGCTSVAPIVVCDNQTDSGGDIKRGNPHIH